MRKHGRHFPGKYRRDPGAWAHAIGMQQQLTGDQLTDLGMAVHTCIERMRTGNGIELDWHTLAAAVNVRGHPEWRPILEKQRFVSMCNSANRYAAARGRETLLRP